MNNTIVLETDPSHEEVNDDGNEEIRTLTVTAPTDHGRRLDQFLAQHVQEFSRSYLQQLITDGLLLRNGAVCTKASAKLRLGDTLALTMRATAQSTAFIAEDIPIDVVYEDDDIVLINKPAGLVVHPAAGNWRGTLLNALLHRYTAATTLPRAGIVHRLDKDTSGLMVVARTRQSFDRLVKQIAARTVHREYWALAHKHWAAPPEKTITVEQAIGRDTRNRLRMAVVNLEHQNGKTAKTDFHLIGNSNNTNAANVSADVPACCWVQCKLHTGRTHQIRVHMQHLGHPLLGDTIYGGAVALGMQRQALHAFRLRLQHPITGKPVQCEAAVPQDMQNAIEAMGLGGTLANLQKNF